MPAWLIRFAPHGLAALAVIGALWWIDHRGYRRAMAERDMRDARLLATIRTDLRRSEQALAAAIADAAAGYERRRAALDAQRATLQPILMREIASESRLADPALGLTPGLLDAVNRARAAGACAAPAPGGAPCPVPAAAADR